MVSYTGLLPKMEGSPKIKRGCPIEFFPSYINMRGLYPILPNCWEDDSPFRESQAEVGPGKDPCCIMEGKADARQPDCRSGCCRPPHAPWLGAMYLWWGANPTPFYTLASVSVNFFSAG